MKKVLFIRPTQDVSATRAGRRQKRAWPPLSLLNSAALAREKGYSVELLDLKLVPLSIKELEKKLKSADYIFITTSPLDRWQCPELDIENILAFIRGIPGEKVYMCGAHGTIYPEWLLNETNARVVIRGEPEETILEILKSDSIKTVKGITFKKENQIVSNPDRPPFDLNSLPTPAYDLVDIRNYSYELLGSRLALIEASRGCTFSCSFCLKSMYGRGFRLKSKEQVAEEIEMVTHRYGARSIYFIDPEFTLNHDMVKHVCKIMRESQVKVGWCCQTRVDLVNKDLLKEMSASGCQLIHYGIESGSQRILNNIRKKTNLAKVKDVIKDTHSVGIDTACFFLFGFPDETMDEMKATLDLAKSLNATYASFHIPTPYPGTELNKFAEENIRFPKYCKSDIPQKDLEKFVKKAYLAYYLRLKYVWKQFKRMKPSLLLRQLKMLWLFLK